MLSGAARLAATLTRRAVRDRRGVAAVEFALIAPLMILLFFGLAQLSQAIIASRHANHVASSLGDLVSQCSNINDDDLGNIFAAGGDIMTPLPAGATLLGQRVTSVAVTDSKGTTQAQWSQASDQPGLTTAYARGQVVTLPANIVTSQGDSVILAETVYKYAFPFTAGGLLPLGRDTFSLSFGHAMTFDDKTYFKPRKSATVAYTGKGAGGSGELTGIEGASCYAS
jgi:Flp pilus assembly protein TadG